MKIEERIEVKVDYVIHDDYQFKIPSKYFNVRMCKYLFLTKIHTQ
jgi:hypothetical protein